MANVHSKTKRCYLPEYLDFATLLPIFGQECNPKLERNLCVIVSKIIEAYKRNDVQDGFFVSLYAQDLKRDIGDEYKEALRVLINLGIVKENPRYAVGRFPKSYALRKAYAAMKTREVSFKTKKNPVRPDKTKLTNPILKFIHHNIIQLGLDEEAIESSGIRSQLPLERAAKFDAALERFKSGRFDVRQSEKVDRTYSLIVECPREFRGFLTYKGKKLVEADIRTAFPTLLLSLYETSESQEKETYKTLLDSDIYAIADMPRDKAKEAFQTFCSGNHRKTNRMAIAYRNRVPILYDKVCSVPGSCLNCFLQDLESDIMNYTIVAKCAEMGLFIIPIHDGFMATQEGAITISHLLREEFWKRFAYRPAIKTVDYDATQDYAQFLSNSSQVQPSPFFTPQSTLSEGLALPLSSVCRYRQ